MSTAIPASSNVQTTVAVWRDAPRITNGTTVSETGMAARMSANSSPADSVVLAIGAEADDSVAQALADCGLPLQRIGDCASVSYIEGAMHSGHKAGREV